MGGCVTFTDCLSLQPLENAKLFPLSGAKHMPPIHLLQKAFLAVEPPRADIGGLLHAAVRVVHCTKAPGWERNKQG